MPNYLCVINQAGPANYGPTSSPNIYVNLTDTGGSFATTWFSVAEGIQDQILDLGIAAIIRREHVHVTADAPNAEGAPYTEITRMLRAQPVVPATPTGLHVIRLSAASEGRSIIEFAWTDNSGGEAGFDLHYLGNLLGITFDNQVINNLKDTRYTFNVLNGYTYTATVNARNIVGLSPTDSVIGTVPGTPPVPAAPSGLQVTVAAKDATDSIINLRWTINSTNETGFTVSFTAIAGSGVTLAPISVPAYTPTCSLSVVNNGTTYSVTVAAYNPSGSASSAAATFTVPPPSVVPNASINAHVNPVAIIGGTEWDLDISGSNFQDKETIQLVITWWASNDGDPNVYSYQTPAGIVGGFTYSFPNVNDPETSSYQRFTIQATGLTSQKTASASI